MTTKKQKKCGDILRLVFEDVAYDKNDACEETFTDKINNYKTICIELPGGFNTNGYRFVGCEWEPYQKKDRVCDETKTRAAGKRSTTARAAWKMAK